MNISGLRERDQEHVWHPYTRRSAWDAHPWPMIVRGEGPWLYDEHGRAWLDAVSSWWACALGHRPPRVIDAIRDQAERLDHSILGHLSHPPAVELATRLAARMPSPDRHALFASDGASSVEAALKIALQYHANRGDSARRELAHLTEAYHGDTLGALSVGYIETFHRAFATLRRPTLALTPPYGGADADRRFAEAQALFDEHGPTLAALIVEPLCQGAAGMKMYPADYLNRLAGLCRAAGALLIVDEIAVGFGRTGSYFAFEQAGIDPDIVCVGKALSAGTMPISATIVRDDIYAAFDDRPEDHTFYHGHTFAGHPISAAAALAAMSVYDEIDIAARGRRMGSRIRDALDETADMPGIRETRVLGGIGAVEFETAASAQRCRERLMEDRILTRPLGAAHYIMPPLNLDDDTLRFLLERWTLALRETCSKAGVSR